VEQGGDWALCCLLYNQPFTFYVGLVGAVAFHSSSVEYLLQNTHIQAVSNSCLPRLQAQSFIFLLHCVCICQRRLSDLSSVLIGFRSVRICIYPMCIVTAVFDVCRRRQTVVKCFHALILLSLAYRTHLLLHNIKSISEQSQSKHSHHCRQLCLNDRFHNHNG